jgi:hypothetical protein
MGMMEWFMTMSIGTFRSDMSQECGDAWSVRSASSKEKVVRFIPSGRNTLSRMTSSYACPSSPPGLIVRAPM